MFLQISASPHFGQCSLLTASKKYLLCNDQSFLFTHFFDYLFRYVVDQDVTSTVVCQLLGCSRQEEGVVVRVDLVAMEDELWLRNSAGHLQDVVVEFETFKDWDESIHQEEVGAVLDLFVDDATSETMDDIVDHTVGLGACLHRAEIHTFHDSGI